jgi:6-phospho-3-hexuloisomerase
MSHPSPADALRPILAEMAAVFDRLDPDAVATIAGEIARARRVVLYGIGRNGVMVRGFAMRLAHLGRAAHLVDAMDCPPVGPGDLFLAPLAVGRLPTADALIQTARGAGARVLIISARPDLVQGADLVVALPAQTMADRQTSALPLGSPFELALHLLFELVVNRLMTDLGRANADLAARHANLL